MLLWGDHWWDSAASFGGEGQQQVGIWILCPKIMPCGWNPLPRCSSSPWPYIFFLVQCRQRNVYSILMSCPCLTGLNCAWHSPGVGWNGAAGKDSRNVLRIKRFLLTQGTPWLKICHLKSSLLPRSMCLSHFLALAMLLWHFPSRNKE